MGILKFHINMSNKKILIFTIIIFIIGVINLFYNIHYCKTVYFSSVIIGFIPVIVLIIRNNIAQSKKRFKYYSVVTPTLIGIFVAIMFFNFVMIKVMNLDRINTNVKDYEKYLRLNNYSDNIYINHLPQEIPLDSKNIKLEEKSGFKNKFYLSYNLDFDEIKLVDGNANILEYKKVIKNFDQLSSTMEELQVPKEAIDLLDIKEEEKSTSNFKIFLLDSTGVESISHGYAYGIGINYDENKVLYFSEKW